MTGEAAAADQWERAIAELVASIRRGHAAVAKRMREEGAEPWEFVVAETAERLLPCPVIVHLGTDVTVVQLRLSEEPWSFTLDASSAGTKLRGPDDEKTIAVSDPSSLTVTIYADTPASLLNQAHAIRLHLNSVFEAMAIEEEDRLLIAREREYEAIGYRELRVSAASGQPDVRWAHLVKLLPEGPRHLDQSDLLAYLPTTRTLAVVPEEIDSLVQSARLLLIHGWEQWEFFSLAEQQSIIALESSGRRLADEWQRDRGVIQRFKAIRQSNRELVAWLRDAGLLTTWEARRASNLFALRNELVHTPFAQTHLDSWATDLVIRSVRLINLMWMRYAARPIA